MPKLKIRAIRYGRTDRLTLNIEKLFKNVWIYSERENVNVNYPALNDKILQYFQSGGSIGF